MSESPAVEALGSGKPLVAALVAWTPWVAAAAGGSVLRPGVLTRLGGVAVSVPLAVGAVGLALWGALRVRLSRVRAAWPFGAVGILVLAPVALATLRAADTRETAWLGVGLLAAVLLGLWGRNALARHGRSEPAARIGGFVVFGHAFDALTTAIGVDVLGFRERTPLSRLLLEVTGQLPVSDLLGVSWLFIAVKLALAAGVVVLFVDYGHSPSVDVPVVALAGFVGLWPAAHNVVLFATA